MYPTKHLLTAFEYIRLVSTRDGHTKPNRFCPLLTTCDHL